MLRTYREFHNVYMVTVPQNWAIKRCIRDQILDWLHCSFNLIILVLQICLHKNNRHKNKLTQKINPKTISK